MKDWFIDLKVFLAGSGYFIIGFSNVDFIMKFISFILFAGITATDALNNLNTSKANDNAVVHKTGNLTETINGFKDFTSGAGVSGSGSNSGEFRVQSNGGSSAHVGVLITQTGLGRNTQFTSGASSGIMLDLRGTLAFSSDFINATINNILRFKVGSNGNVTANSFIKNSGTNLQFLKADGSVDSNIYSTDANVIHKTGDLAESANGEKTLLNQL